MKVNEGATPQSQSAMLQTLALAAVLALTDVTRVGAVLTVTGGEEAVTLETSQFR